MPNHQVEDVVETLDMQKDQSDIDEMEMKLIWENMDELDHFQDDEGSFSKRLSERSSSSNKGKLL